jgi:hypothetical protein
MLQVFTRGEYDDVVRRMPSEKVAEHMQSDREFICELIRRCNQAGIAIQAPVEDISQLMYVLFFSVLHQDDFGAGQLSPGIEVMVELVAAYCLGEVQLQTVVGAGQSARADQG